MPHIKNALIRFRIIDKMLRNKYKPFPSKNEMREMCEESLYGSTTGNHICDSTIEKDLFNTLSDLKTNENSFKEKIISDKTLSKILSLMINKLPASQKEIVKLRFFENLSFKEIAEMNNISINTALGRVRYSINNLRKTMNKSKLRTELLDLI